MRLHLSLLAVLAATLIAPASAHAFVLGAADGSTEAAPIAAQLGARVYRLVMDPAVPLDEYAPRIEAYRAYGMRPQFVIGGTGTTVRGKTNVEKWQIVNYAVHALRRWPDAYSVSVVNEPNLSGISACQYAATFRTAYRMLKRAGAQRVLFGEWAPKKVDRWTGAVRKCRPVVADGFAWHAYDWSPAWTGITKAGAVHKMLRRMRVGLATPQRHTLPIFITEYGVPTPGRYSYSAELNGPKLWARAFALVRKHHIEEIVAWGILEVNGASPWDTSLVDAEGTPRPAFATVASAR
jgi:hypothetical protein